MPGRSLSWAACMLVLLPAPIWLLDFKQIGYRRAQRRT
jgi:hypothetical protein